MENQPPVSMNELDITTFCKTHHLNIEDGEFRMSLSKEYKQQTQYKFHCKKGQFTFKYLSKKYKTEHIDDLFKELMGALAKFIHEVESVSKDVDDTVTMEELRRRIAIYEKYCNFKCFTWPVINQGEMVLLCRYGTSGAALSQTFHTIKACGPNDSAILKEVLRQIKCSLKI